MAARLPFERVWLPSCGPVQLGTSCKICLGKGCPDAASQAGLPPFPQINCRYEAPTDSDAPKVLLLSLRRCKKVQAQLQLAVPTWASEALLLHVLEKQRASPSARGINICLKHRGKQAWLATGWRAWHEGLGWISG